MGLWSVAAWARRIERAFVLEQEVPAAADLLRFYRQVAAFQMKASGAGAPVEQFRGPLLGLLQQRAPRVLANAARDLMYAKDWDPADPAPRFVERVLAQCAPCPGHGRPLCSVQRDGKRSLVCPLCFAEWDFPGIRCARCGENDEGQLPVYTAEQFSYISVEACDSCRSYIKAIDLSKNELAIPEVDELAAVALDVWAARQGYSKIQPNLFGL